MDQNAAGALGILLLPFFALIPVGVWGIYRFVTRKAHAAASEQRIAIMKESLYQADHGGFHRKT